MGIDESSWVLRARIQDHLFEQGFADDLMYVHASIGFEGQVLVSLLPHAYDCAACKTKGFEPRLADAFKQRVRPTWCGECMAATDRRWERTGQLTPRLKVVLEQAFVVAEISPDNPFTSFMVSAPGLIPAQRPPGAGAGKQKEESR